MNRKDKYQFNEDMEQYRCYELGLLVAIIWGLFTLMCWLII